MADGSFGFVNFVEHDAARQAVEALNETEWKGQKLFVGRAQKRSERDEELRKSHEEKRVENEAKSAGVNLYVKNLDGESSTCNVSDGQTSGMTSVYELNLTPLERSLAAES